MLTQHQNFQSQNIFFSSTGEPWFQSSAHLKSPVQGIIMLLPVCLFGDVKSSKFILTHQKCVPSSDSTEEQPQF